jgi:hypothetical protein
VFAFNPECGNLAERDYRDLAVALVQEHDSRTIFGLETCA